MINIFLIIMCAIVPVLEASTPTLFCHKIAVSTLKSDSAKQEYLVNFNIDKVTGFEQSAVTAPVLHCIEGEESIFSKSVNDNGYTVTALVYTEEGAIKLKTSLVVHEGEVVVYTASDDCDLGAYQHGLPRHKTTH